MTLMVEFICVEEEQVKYPTWLTAFLCQIHMMEGLGYKLKMITYKSSR